MTRLVMITFVRVVAPLLIFLLTATVTTHAQRGGTEGQHKKTEVLVKDGDPEKEEYWKDEIEKDERVKKPCKQGTITIVRTSISPRRVIDIRYRRVLGSGSSGENIDTVSLDAEVDAVIGDEYGDDDLDGLLLILKEKFSKHKYYVDITYGWTVYKRTETWKCVNDVWVLADVQLTKTKSSSTSRKGPYTYIRRTELKAIIEEGLLE